MTGNKCYLTDYEDYDGGFVSFRDGKGKISGKGKIRTGTLDFDDVYFCKELMYNMFSVSRICDKKNNVLFSNTECLVLSSNFKLLDESQLLLRAPRKDNIYSIDLKSVVSTGERKATQSFYKAKLMNSINKPLHMLHMDLFGLTNVKSLMKKSYCLVIIDDFSRFSWVFFLATKDETSEILKTFITGIENQLDCKVKVIRCDNGTEFKNSVMNQFCDMKGIKREFSVARTLQQNGVAKRKNKTLIEAARTMIVQYAGKKVTEVHESQVSDNSGYDDQVTRSEFEGLLQKERQTEHINSTNSFNTVSSPVNTAGPLFANTASPSHINAVGTPASTNAFEEHPFE
nr:hypothetical protein [Tanacetum cinerariifolium]